MYNHAGEGQIEIPGLVQSEERLAEGGAFSGKVRSGALPL
jgi:hypothetical protein